MTCMNEENGVCIAAACEVLVAWLSSFAVPAELLRRSDAFLDRSDDRRFFYIRYKPARTTLDAPIVGFEPTQTTVQLIEALLAFYGDEVIGRCQFHEAQCSDG